jgi:hypothetical protein
MGLLSLFEDDGSTYANGGQPGQPNTILATNQSQLHIYSVGRDELFQEVNNNLQAYDDGVTNFLHQPSQLDINNGYTPNQYRYNLPEGVSI